ncbi:Adenylate kinase 8-like isoform X2 [Oopsacas minuta]|uniref:Adenylate kinase 8-like isoform X2 n=1 Tax=Oopsacas minuta TaxID=111878 RepID=A0AAV7JTB5_9METZ|nr:Adenylate kinase 8-like isoform X2 [Oopsacas minuta]
MDSTQKPLVIPPEYSAYAENHSLFAFFRSVLEELSIHKPKDPLQRIVEICKRKDHKIVRIFVLGPPSSGKKTLGKQIARKLKCKFIDPEIIFKDTDKGEQINEQIEKGIPLTPRQKTNIISQYLRKSDLLTRGMVMSGFPTTPEEARLLQAEGVLADHIIFLDGTRSVLQERSDGKRIDSLTEDIYHFPLNMPDNPDVTARLREVPDARSVFERQWTSYYRHLDSLQQCYDFRDKPLKNVYSVFSIDQPLQSLASQVFEFLSQNAFRTLSPVVPRVLLLAAPGAGKNTQAAMLSEKYNLVNIDFDLILKEIYQGGGALAERMKLFVNRNLPLPTELLIKVLLPRLSTLDAAKRGWVLHSFPNTGEEAQSLISEGVLPNRVVYLDVSRDVVIERLTLRRIDPITGRTYHTLYNPPPNTRISSRTLVHPQDEADVVTQRIVRFESYQSEIQEMYEMISKHINGEQDPHAVFECVENFIVNELSHPYDQSEMDI